MKLVSDFFVFLSRCPLFLTCFRSHLICFWIGLHLLQNYVAPEVIMGHYHPAPADMWSLGVVSYSLMSYTFPFDADSTEGIQRNILCKRCRMGSLAAVLLFLLVLPFALHAKRAYSGDL